jgi:predicted RNase H-like HicB family nuclease
MYKISYPAVFFKNENSFCVQFPDLPGCLTEGKTLEEAYSMAKEALGLYLDTSKDIYNNEFKKPSKLADIIKQFPNEIVMFIDFDSLAYAKFTKSKAVKKTLSIPEWLNEEATKYNVNFSQILQEALIEKLDLD